MDQEEHIEVKHKKFSNGDVFIGGWKAGLVSDGNIAAACHLVQADFMTDNP